MKPHAIIEGRQVVTVDFKRLSKSESGFPMRYKRLIPLTLLMLGLWSMAAHADQLVLKNGKEHSGKFVRADANVVEFRILGKIETFKTSEVSQIVFKEPELVNPPSSRTVTPGPTQVEPIRQVPPEMPPPEQGVRSNRDSAARAADFGASQNPKPSVTLPEGTALTIRTTTPIDTERNRVGDSFDAVLDEPLAIGSQTIAPRGSAVRGVIAYSQESGRISGQSELIIELTELRIDNRTYPLRTSDYSEIGSSRGRRTAATVGGAAALGAIIGGIAGGGKGAAIGAASGAAVGTGVSVMTRGQTLKIPAETVLEFKLQHPLTIEIQ